VSAGRYNFTIEQGATFRRVFTWFLDEAMSDEQDLTTGWTAELQIRDESGAVVVQMADGDGISLGSISPGAIECRLEAAETADLAQTTNPHVYDLLLHDGTTSVRLVQGAVTVSPQVTV